MNAPPNDTFSGNEAPLRRLLVYVAPGPLQQPVIEDEQTDLIVESIHHRAGSQMMWATLRKDLARGQRIEDFELTAQSGREVEIWVAREQPVDEDDEDQDPRERPLFWGEVTELKLAVRNGNEVLLYVCRIEPVHTGIPCEGMLQGHVLEADVVLVHHDLEFNPTIDGEETANKFVPNNPEGFPKAFPTWIDPDAVSSTEAETFQEGTAEAWALSDIVETLLSWLNEEETWFKNPSRAVIDKLLPDPPEIVDVTLKRGRYLPSLLDELLAPLGYSWAVRFYYDEEESRLWPLFGLYKRGEGDRKSVRLARSGSTADFVDSNLEALDVAIDIGSLANVVRGEGGLIQREMTCELVRGWDDADEAAYDSRDISNPVKRKWVFNEGGDYTGLRTEITETPDLGPNFLPRKRPMSDCLTLVEGERRHAFVEYTTDDGENWFPLPEEGGYQWRPLRNEVGILLTAIANPDGDGGVAEELQATSSDLRIRITCTLTADKRLEYETSRSDDSPNTKDLVLELDLSNRFYDRQRETEGDHASVLEGDTDERDDTEALEEFIDAVADNEQSAAITASLPLEGLQFDYAIGDLIDRVEGRNISLNRNSREAEEERFLQVVGIDYLIDPQQKTVLHVAPYDLIPDQGE